MATLKPWPSAPRRAFSGTNASWKCTSWIWAPHCPIFRSGGPTVTPGVRPGTRKALTPAEPGSSGAVRAITVKSPALPALVMKRLEPFNTQPPSRRSARVRTAPLSDPASGSVRAKDVMISPLAIPGR